MLIKFFAHGQGRSAAPINYLLATEVLAYDQQRNVKRDENNRPILKIREPSPELLRGCQQTTAALIDSTTNVWKYRSGVIAFSRDDAPTAAQQTEVMDEFERLAFAGLSPHQRNILWVRHSHEDNVELHFIAPRVELRSGKSHNIAPPGYHKHFDALRDYLNKKFDWADPEAPELARETTRSIETKSRAEGRDELNRWVSDHISLGLIVDRITLCDALREVGFELTRLGKNYITVKDPQTDERWRLKGAIYNEEWRRTDNTTELETPKQLGSSTRRASRLDQYSSDELHDKLDEYIERRAVYNRERYPDLRAALSSDLSRRDEEAFFAPETHAASAADFLDLDSRSGTDHEFCNSLLSGGVQPKGLSPYLGHQRAPDKDRKFTIAGPQNGPLHLLSFSHPDITLPKAEELDDARKFDPIRASIVRTIESTCGLLFGVREHIEGFRETLDLRNHGGTQLAEGMRKLASNLTSYTHTMASKLYERCLSLRAAGRDLEGEITELERDERTAEIKAQREENLGLDW